MEKGGAAANVTAAAPSFGISARARTPLKKSEIFGIIILLILSGNLASYLAKTSGAVSYATIPCITDAHVVCVGISSYHQSPSVFSCHRRHPITAKLAYGASKSPPPAFPKTAMQLSAVVFVQTSTTKSTSSPAKAPSLHSSK